MAEKKPPNRCGPFGGGTEVATGGQNQDYDGALRALRIIKSRAVRDGNPVDGIQRREAFLLRARALAKPIPGSIPSLDQERKARAAACLRKALAPSAND